jgi:hypothetical protein
MKRIIAVLAISVFTLGMAQETPKNLVAQTKIKKNAAQKKRKNALLKTKKTVKLKPTKTKNLVVQKRKSSLVKIKSRKFRVFLCTSVNVSCEFYA